VRRVPIFCDAESHAPKVVKVSHMLMYGSGSTAEYWGIKDSVALDGSEVIDRRKTFGTPKEGPTDPRPNTRNRATLRCVLCGLNVVIREEQGKKLAKWVTQSGASRIRLSELAASL
jgi:hypothetical protein